MNQVNHIATVGVDLGDRYSHFLAIDADGAEIDEGRLDTTKKGFSKVFGAIERRRVVIECGTHSPWVSRCLEEFGHEVVVANPRKVALIARGRTKTDRRDAELLARLGRSDIALLSPLKHRGARAAADLAQIRARAALVEARVALVNHVRGVVKSFGSRIPACSTAAFSKTVVDLIPAELVTSLQPLLDQIDSMSKRIKEMKRQIDEDLPTRYPEISRLRQVAGVGPITAAAFVLTIENPDRFTRNRHVGAFLGLTPARRQSGDQDPELGISKCGDKYLRAALVECAQYILSSRGPDTDLKRFGKRIASRGRRAVKKKAVVATARKLAVLLCALWRSGEDYQPIGHAMPAVA